MSSKHLLMERLFNMVSEGEISILEATQLYDAETSDNNQVWLSLQFQIVQATLNNIWLMMGRIEKLITEMKVEGNDGN